jgi:hypothetical protein
MFQNTTHAVQTRRVEALHIVERFAHDQDMPSLTDDELKELGTYVGKTSWPVRSLFAFPGPLSPPCRVPLVCSLIFSVNSSIRTNSSQPLAVSVARMYTSIGGGSGGGHDEWQYVGVWGAVALIVDRQHPAKPRLIQLWDLQVPTLGDTVCALLMHG